MLKGQKKECPKESGDGCGCGDPADQGRTRGGPGALRAQSLDSSGPWVRRGMHVLFDTFATDCPLYNYYFAHYHAFSRITSPPSPPKAFSNMALSMTQKLALYGIAFVTFTGFMFTSISWGLYVSTYVCDVYFPPAPSLRIPLSPRVPASRPWPPTQGSPPSSTSPPRFSLHRWSSPLIAVQREH